MSITAKKITTTITISGQAQSSTTASVQGRIDQIILESSIIPQDIDLVLKNHTGLEIYRRNGVHIDAIVNDIRPDVLPLGPVTISIENPLTGSGTVTITFIEKERES